MVASTCIQYTKDSSFYSNACSHMDISVYVYNVMIGSGQDTKEKEP